MKKFSIIFVFVLICSSVFLFGCNHNALTVYNIEMELNGNVISGTETVEYVNNSDTTVNELKFNLFANAYREGAKFSPIGAQYNSIAYYDGTNYGKTEIQNVRVNGNDVNYQIGGQDENILSFDIPELFPNESVSVKIEFSVTIPKVISRLGENEKTINLSTFYPILCGWTENGFYECVYYSVGDPFFSDCANYNVAFTCDGVYMVATSGVIEKTKTNGEKKTYNIVGKNLRSFSMVLSKEYKAVIDTSLGFNVTYFYYADDNPNESVLTAVKAIKTFSELFGEYPFNSLTVAQTKFTAGGMEYPTLVYVSDDLDQKSYYEVIVHETAHQWWQSAVGNNEIEYGFLDEGLCEYSTVLFYEKNGEYEMTRKKMIESAEKTYKTFCGVYDKLFGKVDTSMKRSLKDFSSEYEYVNIAYLKSAVMYDNLRTTIGDATFFKCLKRYYADYKYKNATPDDLMGIFERYVDGAEGFLSSFISGKAII